ncbi:hypothetical protein WJW27_002676 [Escherichia coli]|uniref:hypothetical protein n=1 Tax=Escherichia coli TaxID=562 RepID=UPI002377B1AA|nr:hypothetical protein vBEcoMphAPEC6_02185 [Escherichia phage ph0011]
MSIDLHNELQYFFDLDISRLNRHVNHISRTIWWSDEADEPRIQICDNLSVLRLYVLDTEMNIMITYVPPTNKLLINTLNPDTVLKIFDLDTIQSSETLFQRSLVDDLGGISFDDILKLKKMYNELLEIKNTVLMGI